LSGDFFCNEEKYYRIEIPYIPTLSEGDNVNDTESTLKSALKSTLKSGLKSTLKSGLKTENKILDLIRDNNTISYAEIVETLGMARSGIAKQIKKLQEEGRLRRVGPDKGGHWEVTES
jgi:predicted HTH transcriptional regulator